MKAINYKKAFLTFIGILTIIVVVRLVEYAVKSDDKLEEAPMNKAHALDVDQYQSVEGIINIQYWKNQFGVPVYFVQAPGLPMVDIEVVLDAGSARNSDLKPLAYFTNVLLDQGTSKLNADSIAEQFEALGAQFDADSYRDMAVVSLRTLTDDKALDPAVSLFSLVLSDPIFDEQSLSREKQNTQTTLKHQAQKPSSVIKKAFYETIYPDAPYGRWVLGDEASVGDITQQDLKQFHQQYYVQNNVKVVIVGDVSSEKANQLSMEVVKNLKQGEKPKSLPALCLLSEPINKDIEFKSTQTHIVMGAPLLTHQDPDYFALMVGNHILGGSAQNSRIFDTIRGEHGLAYSAYSHVIPMKQAGPFMIVCQTQNKNAQKALDMMQQLLNDFIEEGPTKQELEDAKKNLLGGFALHFDSNESILNELAKLSFYELPLEYFNEYPEAISAVDLDSIRLAFQKRINPKQMAFIRVGAKS